MMSRIWFFTLFALATSLAHAQPSPTSSELDCFSALNRLNGYIDASEGRGRNQYVDGSLSKAELDTVLSSLEGLRSTYTMTACMNQQFENSFHCFATSNTDLALCAE